MPLPGHVAATTARPVGSGPFCTLAPPAVRAGLAAAGAAAPAAHRAGLGAADAAAPAPTRPALAALGSTATAPAAAAAADDGPREVHAASVTRSNPSSRLGASPTRGGGTTASTQRCATSSTTRGSRSLR
eukprot:357002-Chlamydomonas_euryale.AAC.6